MSATFQSDDHQRHGERARGDWEHFTEFWLFGVFFAAIARFQALSPLAYFRWPMRITAGIELAANLGTVLLWPWTRFVGAPEADALSTELQA